MDLFKHFVVKQKEMYETTVSDIPNLVMAQWITNLKLNLIVHSGFWFLTWT
jgi:hypothetical protein